MAENKTYKVGQKTMFFFNNLSFQVEILAIRKRREQEYLVTPVNGKGQDWFSTFNKRNKK